MSKRISENKPVIIYPQNSCESRASPDPPRPSDRAKSHPHSSPRAGFAAKLGERRFFKVAFPETARNHITFPFGLAVERSTLDVQSVSSNPPFSAFSLLFSLFFLLFTKVQIPLSPFYLYLKYIFLLHCCTYEYCCCSVVHTWWFRGLLLRYDFFCCVLCFTSVPPGTTYCCTAIV